MFLIIGNDSVHKDHVVSCTEVEEEVTNDIGILKKVSLLRVELTSEDVVVLEESDADYNYVKWILTSPDSPWTIDPQQEYERFIEENN